jgi:hypothetical protein
VVPASFRRKGSPGALGAALPGQSGPFGVRPHPLVPGPGAPASPWPTLAVWMEGAVADHPLWDLAEHQDEAGARAGLDSLEVIVAAVDTALRAADTKMFREKIRDFATLRSHRQLLDLRAELAVGAALAAAGLAPVLGDTRFPNPDFLVTLSAGARAGMEVTAPAPEGIGDLVERIEDDVLASRPGQSIKLEFSRYPSRVRAAAADRVVAAAHGLLDGAVTTATVDLPADVPNDAPRTHPDQEPVSVRVSCGQGDGMVDWSVAAGELTQPMGSAEFAAFTAGTTPSKAKQGRSQQSAPVVLATDMSRYGSAWMRSAGVWTDMLARSEHFTADYPFAALVVFRQSLPVPAVLDPAVGINPHLPATARARVEELCQALEWPYA